VILSIDPGAKPGYVLLAADGTLLRASHKAEAWALAPPVPFDLAVTEGQRIFHDSEADPNKLFVLAMRAGWQLCRIPAKRYMRLEPQAWRGRSTAAKEQLQNRILRTRSKDEREHFRAIPKTKHGDVLDSIAIGRAALKFATTTNEYDWIAPP
jgi:hypothetical protein